MNYTRVYAQFIASRRQVKHAAGECVEKHHILPRSVGGGDDPANIIRLTPEDHFFAHLLLARIHGGRMWAPIAIMLNKSRGSRRRHGMAVRAMAKALSGEGAHQFDRNRYELRHADGRKWQGMRADMAGLGISESLACMLIGGSVKQAKGWSLPGVVGGHPSGDKHPMHKAELITLHHVDGRKVTATRLDLNALHAIPRSGISRLVNGQAVVWNGWHKPGATLPTLGRSATSGRRG